MKRSFFIILLASIINTSGLCQENSFKGPIIYVEAAGSGFSTYNLNVEHLIITRSKWGVNARLGYGYLKAGGTIDQDIVAGVNVYYGNKITS